MSVGRDSPRHMTVLPGATVAAPVLQANGYVSGQSRRSAKKRIIFIEIFLTSWLRYRKLSSLGFATKDHRFCTRHNMRQQDTMRLQLWLQYAFQFQILEADGNLPRRKV